MARFRYTASDSDNRIVTGEISAANEIEAVGRLQAENLRVERLESFDADLAAKSHSSAAPEPQPGRAGAEWRLSDEHAVETTGRIAEITRAELPLGPGLRALCEELPASRLRNSLMFLSERLESGESLESAIEVSGVSLPRGLRAILRAGARTNRMGLLLEQYLNYSRRAIDERRQAVLSLAYPATLLGVAALVLGYCVVWIVPGFQSVFQDFGMQLPAGTRAILYASDFLQTRAVWVLIGVAASAAVAYYVAVKVWGPGRGRRLLLRVPVLGAMFGDAALAQYCGFLALLIESRVGLPESIEIAGEASHDAGIAEDSRWMADGLRQGMRLDEAALLFSRVHPELRHAFRWEGQPDALVSSLRAAGEIFSARARVRAGLMRGFVSPLIVAGTGFLVLALMGLLFLPLVNLLNSLSS